MDREGYFTRCGCYSFQCRWVAWEKGSKKWQFICCCCLEEER